MRFPVVSQPRVVLVIAALLVGCGPPLAIPNQMLEGTLTPVPVPRGETTTITLRWIPVEGNASPDLSFEPPFPPGVTLAFARKELNADVLVAVTVTADAPLSSYDLWIRHTVPDTFSASLLSIEVVE